MKIILTDKHLSSNLDPGIYRDIPMPGLQVRVSESGYKSWRVEYKDVRNKKRVKTLGPVNTETKTVSQMRAEAEEIKKSYGHTETFGRYSLGGLKERYMTSIYMRCSLEHSKATKRYLENFVDWYEERMGKGAAAVDVTKADVSTAVYELYFLKGMTVAGNRFIVAVHGMFQYIIESEGVQMSNPAKIRKAKEQPRETVLTDKEWDRLGRVVDGMEQEEKVVMGLLMLAGLRQAEVALLKWKHIDFEDRTITIVNSKNRAHAVIPMHKDLHKILSTRWAAMKILGTERTGAYPEFILPVPATSKEAMHFIRKTWIDAFKKAGIGPDKTGHDLRRTFGMRVAKKEGLHVASKLLRHSSVRVTETVYAPMDLGYLQSSLDRVSL
jgi:integrase